MGRICHPKLRQAAFAAYPRSGVTVLLALRRRREHGVHEAEDGTSEDGLPEADEREPTEQPGDAADGQGVDGSADGEAVQPQSELTTERASGERAEDTERGEQRQQAESHEEADDADEERGAKTGPDAPGEDHQVQGRQRDHEQQHFGCETDQTHGLSLQFPRVC